MNKLQFAIRYINAGIAAIPIWAEKRKNPYLSSYSEYYKKLPTEAEWKKWIRRWPNANIGLVTGYWDYVALDFDDTESYQAWRADHQHIDTWVVRTGRGYHVWAKANNDPGKSRMFTRNGYEVLLRAKGGYVISPPSLHWTGKRYRTEVKSIPIEAEITDILSGWQEKKSAARPKPKPIGGGYTEYSIDTLIQTVGKPNIRGAQQAYCPFHQDDRPSAWVNVAQGRFGCNACWPGQWFDNVNVYAMMNGLTNNEAFKIVRGKELNPLPHQTG